MQLKTILNRVAPIKPFVYKKVAWADPETQTAVNASIAPRANGQATCSKCECRAPTYDHLPLRQFEFVPFWGLAIYFIYAMRRVDCPRCGVKVEKVPWCDGKNRLTTAYRWFLASWAKQLSWKGVAESFGTTWQNVFRSVKYAVRWGLAHRDLEGIESIGVDEVPWQKGHKYLTLVYQIDAGRKRLLWIGKDRTAKTLLRFFRMLGKERSSRLRFICSDMWKFLDEWCTRTMRSKIEPMKEVAWSLRKHRELILNWFRAQGAISAGIVEGLNTKVKLTTRKSYGFRTFGAIETALYHSLADLPQPRFKHRFW